jgi:septin family protein
MFRLREIDIELMRRLSPRVNVIPVIGKADSLTPSELRGFKKRVRILIFCFKFDAYYYYSQGHGGHRAL